MVFNWKEYFFKKKASNIKKNLNMWLKKEPFMCNNYMLHTFIFNEVTDCRKFYSEFIEHIEITIKNEELSWEEKEELLEGLSQFHLIKDPREPFKLIEDDSLGIQTALLLWYSGHEGKSKSYDLPKELYLPSAVTDEKLLYLILLHTILIKKFFIYKNAVVPTSLFSGITDNFFSIFLEEIKKYSILLYLKKYLYSDLEDLYKKEVVTNDKLMEEVLMGLLGEDDSQFSMMIDDMVEKYKEKVHEYKLWTDLVDAIWLELFEKGLSKSHAKADIELLLSSYKSSGLYIELWEKYNRKWDNDIELRYRTSITQLFSDFIEGQVLSVVEDVDSSSKDYSLTFLRLSWDFTSNQAVFFMCDYTLLKELSNINWILKPLPMIIPPNNWNIDKEGCPLNDGGYLINKENHFFSMVKPMVDGISSAKLSEEGVKSVNILQSKGFKIHKAHIEMWQKDGEIWEDAYMDVSKRQNQEINNINDLNIYLDDLDINIGDLLEDLAIVHKALVMFKSEQNSADVIEILKRVAEESQCPLSKLTEEVCFQYVWSYYSREDYSVLWDIKKRLCDLQEGKQGIMESFRELMIKKSQVELSVLLEKLDITIYMPSYYCYRLRNYPLSPYFSRTSSYRHFVGLPEGKAFTERGIFWLLLNIGICLGFKGDTIEEYQDIVKEIPGIIKSYFNRSSPHKFFDVFAKAYPENSVKSSAHSRELCLYCILDYMSWEKDKNYKSQLILYVDQAASGPQILSILAGDRNILELTNVTSGNKQNDIYSKYMEDFKMAFNKLRLKGRYKIYGKEFKELEPYLDRSIGKKLLIPFCYGMVKSGLFDLIRKEIFNQEHEYIASRDIFKEEKVLKLFYDLCVESAFDAFYYNLYGLIKYPRFLQELASIVIGETNGMCYKTLDNCKINYNYVDSKWKNIVFKLNNIREVAFFAKEGEINSKKGAYSFRAHFIQSIDGAIARLIIRRMYEEHNIIIQSLHDSFGCHANDIDGLLRVINNIYEENLIKNNGKIIENTIEDVEENKKLAKGLRRRIEKERTEVIESKGWEDIVKKFKNVIFNFFI